MLEKEVEIQLEMVEEKKEILKSNFEDDFDK